MGAVSHASDDCRNGLHASACPRPATPLVAPGNSEAPATEQLDPARRAFSQSAAPPLQAAVVLDLGRVSRAAVIRVDVRLILPHERERFHRHRPRRRFGRRAALARHAPLTRGAAARRRRGAAAGRRRSTTSPSTPRTAVDAMLASRRIGRPAASTSSTAILRNEASSSSTASLPPRTTRDGYRPATGGAQRFRFGPTEQKRPRARDLVACVRPAVKRAPARSPTEHAVQLTTQSRTAGIGHDGSQNGRSCDASDANQRSLGVREVTDDKTAR